jgi:hypothetical protein
MSLIKRMDHLTPGRNEGTGHANEILTGPARVLANRALAGADKSYGEVADEMRNVYEKGGKALDVGAVSNILLEKFPHLARGIEGWKDKVGQLQTVAMKNNQVEIELVTTAEMPVDQGARARWAMDPLTAFLDLLRDCKGVIVESASLASRNGVPLVLGTIQRGDEGWLDDLAALGFKFDGFRSSKDQGPQGHEEALAGMKESVINVPQLGPLVNGAEPNQTLYDFGSVVRLTALDQVGNVVGVATVLPNNADRKKFTHALPNLAPLVARAADGISPVVNADRVSVNTTVLIPEGQAGTILGYGANVPSHMVRMDAKIGAQTIIEPGSAIELELSGVRVLATSIPFSHGDNVNANNEVEALRVHKSVGGATFAEMMSQPATLHSNGTSPDGLIKNEGAPIQKTLAAFALPQRERISIAGQALAAIPINNEGHAIPVVEGVDYRDQLKQLGLTVTPEKIAGTTDLAFQVTVDPAFIGRGEGDQVRVGVGFFRGDEWVWADAKKGAAGLDAFARELGAKPESFSVRVPDEVYRGGGDKEPAKMYVRLWTGEGRAPLFLGAANFDMKAIVRNMGELSAPEQIFEQQKSVKAAFAAGVLATAANGEVIADPIAAREMERRMGAGESWSFQFGGHVYAVKQKPKEEGVEAVLHQIYRGDQLLAEAPDLVRTKATDETLPNGYFAVTLSGIANGEALYVGNKEIRRAPIDLPVADPAIPARQARLDALNAKNDQQQLVYRDVLWAGVELGGERINSQAGLDKAVAKLETQRREALVELQRQRAQAKAQAQ